MIRKNVSFFCFVYFQLKFVEEAILRQEEEEGRASDELTQLRSDLREALSLFDAVDTNSVITIDDSEPTPCVSLSSDSDTSDDDDDDDEVEEIEDDAVDKEIIGMQK